MLAGAEMDGTLELFFKAHQYTIAALGPAVSLLAAVVSLWLGLTAVREKRTNLKCTMDLIAIYTSNPDDDRRPTYVAVTIINRGILPASIPFDFLFWRTPFFRNIGIVSAHDAYAGDEWIARVTYPVEIAPKASHQFIVQDISMFREQVISDARETHANRRFLLPFQSAWARSADRSIFRIRLGRDLKAMKASLLAEAARDANA